jgi:hypothetical protein
LLFFFKKDDPTLAEKTVNISKEVTVNEIPARSQSVKASDSLQKSSPNSPNRTIGFKFNKSKKENNENMLNISATRKKLEKLNYKRGIDILEVYKEKCKHLKIDINKTNLESNQKKIQISNSLGM